QIGSDMDILDAELLAELAFLDCLSIEPIREHIRVRDIVLDVDDGANLIAEDGSGEAIDGELAAAVEHSRLNDAQALAVGVAVAVINEWSYRDQAGQSRDQQPSSRHAAGSVNDCR